MPYKVWASMGPQPWCPYWSIGNHLLVYAAHHVHHILLIEERESALKGKFGWSIDLLSRKINQGSVRNRARPQEKNFLWISVVPVWMPWLWPDPGGNSLSCMYDGPDKLDRRTEKNREREREWVVVSVMMSCLYFFFWRTWKVWGWGTLPGLKDPNRGAVEILK